MSAAQQSWLVDVAVDVAMRAAYYAAVLSCLYWFMGAGK